MRFGTGIYVKGSAEAVKLYTEAFGLELGYHVLNDDGSFYHSELCKDGQEIYSVVEKKQENITDDTIQLSVEFDSEEELKKAFNLLCEGGKVDMDICELPWSPCAASVVDRFGVWWYMSAGSHYPDDDFVPERM